MSQFSMSRHLGLIRAERATTVGQHINAQKLWATRYHEAGLCNSDRPVDSLSQADHTCELAPAAMWRTVTFLAYQRVASQSTLDTPATERVCGTVTLLAPEFESNDAGGIGKITRLAINQAPTNGPPHPDSYLRVFLELTSLLHRTALEMQLTHLEAVVHPRHAKLYRRIFKAEVIGQPFACEEVGGSPGQQIRMKITHADIIHTRIRAHFKNQTQRHAPVGQLQPGAIH
ncbi:hypothetical protein NHH03_12280 [Stieleria sp. TO1_6]|uniref:N-acyl amino acid synthase FeeM domain-containing protein n=1 Tax=Stieleria tagensis TaxID=2956795 RepID=UPI00209B2424|nr:hypothetical protein [Stieleria tagensis]MCO8122517.1 hypothetical protein [Stieleria tagensis]